MTEYVRTLGAVLLAVSLQARALEAAQGGPGEQTFRSVCAACHTIGEGRLALRDVLATGHDRLEPMAKQGKTIEEVLAAMPTKGLDVKWGKPRPSEGFLRQAGRSGTACPRAAMVWATSCFWASRPMVSSGASGLLSPCAALTSQSTADSPCQSSLR